MPESSVNPVSPSQWLARWLAAGLGSGWLPKMPGTWGSLACLPVAWLLVAGAGAAWLLVASLLLLLLGCVVCASVLPTLAEDDPGWIVIDEWAGQWLALGMVAMFFGLSVLNVVLAFAAFRLFDVVKPFPIRELEHWGPAWWAIMADDMMAGLMGGCLVLAGLSFWEA
ncbi:MAG TPA: phosphatidylglycerophosphatase A [Mariprofundaceae bacterium]|nr:phosphatidylglycerophosphatase A [Mariprofundaceae bacterium]